MRSHQSISQFPGFFVSVVSVACRVVSCVVSSAYLFIGGNVCDHDAVKSVLVLVLVFVLSVTTKPPTRRPHTRTTQVETRTTSLLAHFPAGRTKNPFAAHEADLLIGCGGAPRRAVHRRSWRRERGGPLRRGTGRGALQEEREKAKRRHREDRGASGLGPHRRRPLQGDHRGGHLGVEPLLQVRAGTCVRERARARGVHEHQSRVCTFRAADEHIVFFFLVIACLSQRVSRHPIFLMDLCVLCT